MFQLDSPFRTTPDFEPTTITRVPLTALRHLACYQSPESESRPELSPYPELQSLLHLWRARTGVRHMPTRADLDTLSLKLWLGHLMLVDVLGRRSFRFRVYGTRVAHLFQKDFQNREIADLPLPDRQYVLEEFETVVRSKTPHFSECHRPYRNLQDFRTTTGWMGQLSLPLSENGAAVSQILTAIYPRQT